MAKKNGFIGEAFIPQEVKKYLHRNFPIQHEVENPDTTPSVATVAREQSTSHFVPHPRIPTKHSVKHSTTSDASQKVSIVKAKKPARTDMSREQPGSRVSHSSPKILEKRGGGTGAIVEKMRKLRMVDDSNSDDDTATLASELNVKKGC